MLLITKSWERLHVWKLKVTCPSAIIFFNAIMNCFSAAKEGYAQSFQNKVSFDVTVMVDGTEIRLKGLGTLIIVNNCGL